MLNKSFNQPAKIWSNFTFREPLSCPLGSKANGLVRLLIELSFPTAILAFPLDCGDSTSPFIMTSWRSLAFEVSVPVGSALTTSILEERLPEPVRRNDFSRMAKVRTWSDGISSSFSVLSLEKLESEALSSWDFLLLASPVENSFAESYNMRTEDEKIIKI